MIMVDICAFSFGCLWLLSVSSACPAAFFGWLVNRRSLSSHTDADGWPLR